MNKLLLLTVLAGFGFGIWPLLLKQSGLSGLQSQLFLLPICLSVVLPFSLWALRPTVPAIALVTFGIVSVLVGLWVMSRVIGSANWTFLIVAAIVNALAFISFMSALSMTPENKTGLMLVTMTIVQIMVPAAYTIFKNGDLTLRHGIGFAAAVVAAILLT